MISRLNNKFSKFEFIHLIFITRKLTDLFNIVVGHFEEEEEKSYQVAGKEADCCMGLRPLETPLILGSRMHEDTDHGPHVLSMARQL